MKGDVTLNVILRCSKCGNLEGGQSYSAEIERVMYSEFPLDQPIKPFMCEDCLEAP